MFASVLLARFFAFGFRFESIFIAATAAIPETSTTSIGDVEVVFNAKVATGALILGKTAGLLLWLPNIFAATKLIVQSFCNTVGTTTVLAFHASATLEVGSLGGGLAVFAALVICLGTMAALVVRSPGEGETIGTATKLHCLAGATLEFESLGSGDLVGTTTISSSFAQAAFLIWSMSRCFLIGTATIRRVGTLTTLSIRSTSSTYIVWAAPKFRVDTATFALWSMSGCLVVWTASEGFGSACSASLSIGS